MKYVSFLVLFLIAILLLNGCGSNEIQGTIKDPFGDGIEGVTVSIEKSDLHSFTGKDGHYSIPAILGTFILKFSKPGYTTQKITLTSQRNTPFPAQTGTLYPIPPEPGLYYMGAKNLIKMSPGKIALRQTREITGLPMRDLWGVRQVKFFPDKTMAAAFSPGKAQFIDTSSVNLVPMRLRSDGCFMHFLIYPSVSEVKVEYEASITQKKTEVGEEKLIIRTIDCNPGSYAWVEFHRDMFGTELPTLRGICYAFQVASQNFAQSH